MENQHLNENIELNQVGTVVVNKRAGQSRDDHELKDNSGLPKLPIPGDPMEHFLPKTGNPWRNWQQRVEKFDNESCAAWKDEIDKLMVFAGLFSAAVTAFAIEAYQWLDNPLEDVNTALLGHISDQIANLTIQADVSTLTNSSKSNTFDTSPYAIISSSSIRINILWFTSLILSLSVVMIGTLCLQWLREYQRDVTQYSFEDAIIIRQLRYQGLMAWKVPQLVSILPVLLQVAVVFFFVGVFDLLLDRNALVAGIVAIPLFVTIAFWAVTTLLPSLDILSPESTRNNRPRHAQSPFKSPQAWILRRGIVRAVNWFNSLWRIIRPDDYNHWLEGISATLKEQSWIDWDLHYRARIGPLDLFAEAWVWSREYFSQTSEPFLDLVHCLEDCVSKELVDSVNQGARMAAIAKEMIKANKDRGSESGRLTDETWIAIFAHGNFPRLAPWELVEGDLHDDVETDIDAYRMDMVRLVMLVDSEWMHHNTVLGNYANELWHRLLNYAPLTFLEVRGQHRPLFSYLGSSNSRPNDSFNQLIRFHAVLERNVQGQNEGRSTMPQHPYLTNRSAYHIWHLYRVALETDGAVLPQPSPSLQRRLIDDLDHYFSGEYATGLGVNGVIEGTRLLYWEATQVITKHWKLRYCWPEGVIEQYEDNPNLRLQSKEKFNMDKWINYGIDFIPELLVSYRLGIVDVWDVYKLLSPVIHQSIPDADPGQKDLVDTCDFVRFDSLMKETQDRWLKVITEYGDILGPWLPT